MERMLKKALYFCSANLHAIWTNIISQGSCLDMLARNPWRRWSDFFSANIILEMLNHVTEINSEKGKHYNAKQGQ